MVFVPVPHQPPRPSPRVQELSDQLGKVIEDYERRFPNLSGAEIRQAAQLAVQRKASGSPVNRYAVTMAAGLAAFVAGLTLFLVQSGSLENVEVPWVMVGIGIVLVMGLAVFLFRREE